MTAPTTSRLPTLLAALLALPGLWGCNNSSGAFPEPPPPPPPAALTVLASTTATTVGTPVTITATVVAADGSPVKSGTTVACTTSAGVLTAVTPTGPAGSATASLSSATGGTATVTCSVGALPSRSVSVRFIDPNAPFSLTLVPAATQAAVRSTVLLAATVRPAGSDGAGGAGGAVADGTLVAFSTSAGTLSAVTTTVGGVATAVLGGVTSPADVVVRASVGPLASPDATITFSDPDVPVRVTTSAAPSAGFIAGKRPVVVTALVERAAGGPPPAGTPVAFAVVSGPGTLSVASALTGADGTASTTVNAVAEGVVAVTATAGAGVVGRADLPFTDPDRPQAVTLLANPAAGIAGGVRRVTLTAVVTPADPLAGRVADGTPVTFSIASGSGTLSAALASTVNGAASVDLDAAAAGTVGVTARVGALVSSVVSATFVAAPATDPAVLTVLASATSTLVGTPVTITASVVTVDGLPVPVGTPVAFSATGGVLSDVKPTSAAGNASATLTGAVGATVTVTCSVGTLAPRSVTVRFVDPNAPFAVSLASSSTRADVGTSVQLTATVRAAGTDGAGGAGGAVADGTVVAFTTSAGTLSAVTTTVGGVATASLGGVATPGDAVVRAGVAGLTSPAVTVAFTDPNLPVRVTASAAPAAGFIGGQRPAVVTALVERAAGGPAPAGTPVTFAVTAGPGTVSQASALTGVDGTASTTLNAPSEGAVTVTATAAPGVAGAVTVPFTDPNKPQAVALVAAPASAAAGVPRAVTLTAVVTPADPVAGRVTDGTPVTFAVVSGAGTLSQAVATTLDGTASVALDAPAAGTVSVTARAGAATSAPASVTFAPPAPTDPAALTVLASATTALVGAPVTITASVVTSSGAPVAAGTAVAFSATGGVLSGVTTTSAAGNATATLTGGAAGTAVVTCSVGALAPRSVAVRFIDPNAPFAVSLAASTARADVGAAVLLTATVRPAGTDGAGGPGGAVADGTVVAFTTSAGTLSAVSTTLGGVATAVLDGVLAPADVVARAAVGALTSADVTVAFSDPNLPVRVTATATPTAGFIGGLRPVGVTAHVERAAGGPVPAGTLVTFAVTAGPGSLSPASALTGPSGDAATVVNAAAEGAVTVTATAAPGVAGAVAIPFTDPNRPAAVSLVASPATAVAGVARAVTLTAVVAPADPVSGAVADGTPVTFAIVAGSGALSATVATTVAGSASVALDAPVAGAVSVTARVGAVTSAAATATFSAPPASAPASLTVLASSTSALVGAPVTITATATTADGAPVATGTPVGFSTTGGVLSNVKATGPTGAATATLVGGAAGLVTVTCSVGTLPPQAVTVRFIDPDAPFAVSLAASATRADVGASVLLTATVRAAGTDGAGGPGGAVADGTVVAFTTSAGTLTAVSTTVGGVATAVLGGVLAPADAVTRAAVGALSSADVTVTFSDPDAPARVTATAAPSTGLVGGQRPVLVTAHVERAAGGPVPAGTPVTFAVSAGPGTLSAASALTDALGDATVTVNASAEGQVTVVAGAAGGASDSVAMAFTDPSKPLAVALFANPASGVANGLRPVTLTAIVSPADPANGAIADGTVVTFTIVSGAGTLSATTDATLNGVASVDLDAAVAGSVGVSARAGSAPVVVSNTVTAAFVVQPTLAIVTVRTTGTLPGGKAIGGLSAVMTASPADGLACAASDHHASGVAAGALLVANPADLGNDRVALVDAAGMPAGEVATITCQVARGTFPTPADFSVRLEGPGVVDLDGNTLAGLGVAIQAVSIQ